MAYAIKISEYPNNVAKQINSLLCLQPKQAGNKFAARGKKEAPVFFLRVDENFVHLPYLFASSFFQVIPNVDFDFPRTEMEFTGELRQNQISTEKEAWGMLCNYGTSTLGLYPGFGKTILGAKLCSRTKLITAVLVHREILTSQWKKTFEEFTTAKVWIVGSEKPEGYSVIICMDARWKSVSEKERDSVGFLIIDEAHSFCTRSRVDCLLAFHPKYILAETATLERDDGMESMIYAICGKHGVFRQTNKPFCVTKVVTEIKPERKTDRMGNLEYGRMVKSVLENDDRNNGILKIVENHPENSILILTWLVDHTKLLHKELKSKNESCDYLCGAKKSYKDCRVLVGTMSKIGTGFDQATACADYAGGEFDILILACSMRKISMITQNVGRIRSQTPIIFCFVDDDPIFENHWRILKSWFLNRGGNIEEKSMKNLCL